MSEQEKSWELTNEQMESLGLGTEKILKDNEKLLLYNEYVATQRNGFISVMNFINNKINDLIQQGRISDFVQIRARIKAAESAVLNDDTKALDDIFGIEIITATEEEIKTIINNLSPYMIKTKCKNHNKPNGYKAKHKYWSFKEDKMQHLNNKQIDYDGIPMIEFQLKTSEVFISCNTGKADHTTYKGKSKEDIQKKYDEGKFNIFTNIPLMWVSKDGKMEMLSPDETLRKIYPFLNTMKQRGK